MRTLLVLAWAFVAVATAADAAAQTLDPAAAGTIRSFPELGIFDVVGAPGADFVSSTYFRTSDVNREFRRGIVEFSVPSATILSATLVLAEFRPTVTAPVPPDEHHLTAYMPADLEVTTADYDRAGTAVGTFLTDANLEQQTFTFDVTALAAAAAGGTLGFRVQLAIGPEYSDFVNFGSAFRITLGIVTPSPLAMGFDFTPAVFNLSSRGRWVTGHLEPPPPIAAADIDIASIRLNGTVAVDPAAQTALGDPDGDGVVGLTVKFARAAVVPTLAEGDNVPVVVTGTVGGEPFIGTDHIQVSRGGDPDSINPGAMTLAIHGATPNPVADGPLRVEFTLRDGSPARLELLDVAGRMLASRQVGTLGAGRHAVDFSDARALPPGVYFVRVTQNGHEARTRAAVVR